MKRFRVQIHGDDLAKAMLALNGRGIPTIGAGAHWGTTPPPDWDLTVLTAVVDAESPQDAVSKVEALLPPGATVDDEEPEPYG
jgi:hypothetical protein